MSVIYVLIPIAILLSALGIYLFFWAVKTDQFEDLEKQGLSILFDDDDTKKNNISEQSDEKQSQLPPFSTRKNSKVTTDDVTNVD